MANLITEQKTGQHAFSKYFVANDFCWVLTAQLQLGSLRKLTEKSFMVRTLRKDRTIHICGDYKSHNQPGFQIKQTPAHYWELMTWNHWAEEGHSPNPEYQQIPLDEDCIPVNSPAWGLRAAHHAQHPQSLYQYNWLPFSALIFQHTM